MNKYKKLQDLVKRIYEDLSDDMGLYFNEIQGNEEETINEITNALLTGNTYILNYMEKDSELYNDIIAFILFDRKRIIDVLIKEAK